MRLDHNLQIRILDAFASRAEPEGERVIAGVYWTLLVVIMLTAIVCGIAYGWWEFTRTPHPDMGSLKPKQSLDRANLQSIVNGFNERSKNFHDRLVAPVSVRDPS